MNYGDIVTRRTDEKRAIGSYYTATEHGTQQ